jgi:CRISPR/Cas system-associated endonuclease Cas1
MTKNEAMTRKKVGKREYLNDLDSKKFMHGLNSLFQTEVEIPRIRHGKKQTFETLINEEALLLAKFLRKERKEWKANVPFSRFSFFN